MKTSYFFYDLETSGLDAKNDRIMQFAGQRTDENLNPIGEPYNLLVELNDDTLPSPQAMVVTGITPQQTKMEGYTEEQFCKILQNEILTEATILVGYNNIRFDDEFLRFLFWRNFHDPYDWSYSLGRSRWDFLDVIRMTRALRPDGINWPNIDGVASNKLELLSVENDIAHQNAHDALSDVQALIGIAKLIKEKQPRLYNYLFKMRQKDKVQELVNLKNPNKFVYSSGRYEAIYQKTTVAYPIAKGLYKNVIVYDLRYDPSDFIDMSEKELKETVFADKKKRESSDFKRVPVKMLKYNNCPVVAPVSVLDEKSKERLMINDKEIARYEKILQNNPSFGKKIQNIFTNQVFKEQNNVDPETQLYSGFLSQNDKKQAQKITNLNFNEIKTFQPIFENKILNELFVHYKARNFPKSLNSEERESWESWRSQRLTGLLPSYAESLSELSKTENVSQFLIDELQLWAESILPDAETL